MGIMCTDYCIICNHRKYKKKDWKHSLWDLGPRAVYGLHVIVKGVAKASLMEKVRLLMFL